MKKNTQPKSWELCFIQGTFLGLWAWEAASQLTLRKLLRGGEERARIYRSFARRAGSRNKTLPLIKENKISQVKKFSTFLCMGRCKSPSSLKLFLWYAPQLSGTSILCFLILSLLKVHGQEWLQQLTARWRASCFYPEFPHGSTSGWL